MCDDRRQANRLQLAENLIDALEQRELWKFHQKIIQTVDRKTSWLAQHPLNILSRQVEVTSAMNLETIADCLLKQAGPFRDQFRLVTVDGVGMRCGDYVR